MGRGSRQKPRCLGSKLLDIRLRLDLSQAQLLKRLDASDLKLQPGHISQFETGTREPSLPILLRYSKISGVSINILADDEEELPAKIPCETTYEFKIVIKE